MMIGWHITPGYSPSADMDNVWEFIKKEALDIAGSKYDIFFEVGEIHDADSEKLLEVCETFQLPDGQGNPMTIIEGDDPQIMLLASGGGEYRDLKEQTRMAFLRLLLKRCNKQFVNITFTVI